MSLLECHKKICYTPYDTPLERAFHLERVLGNFSPQLYFKRDDMLGLASGGNKTRKLEFLMADACDKSATDIITCGAIQSNHCRLTLAAAIKEGLRCHLILEERVKDTFDAQASGNNFLYHLLGASSIKVVPNKQDLKAEMDALSHDLASKGLQPYCIPGGGSNSIGALGYVNGFLEMERQCNDQNIDLKHIVCASGSSGTHAGVLAGICLTDSTVRCDGISVMRCSSEQQERVFSLYRDVVYHLDPHCTRHLCIDDVIVFDDYIGDGYAIPTKEMIAAVKLLAETEGILLDPVYTGKAFAGLLDLIKQGRYSADDAVIFLHTGGSPALYAYQPCWKDTLVTPEVCL